MTTPGPIRRPRVLQCVTHLALGGAERVALSIVRELKPEFDFCVHAVRGFADGEVGLSLARELGQQGIPVHKGLRVPMRFGGMITSGLGLCRAVRRTQPDLIHLHTEIPEAAYAVMVTLHPALRAIPVVRTIHNTVFWAFWPRMGRWCDRRMSHSLIAGVAPGATSAFLRLRETWGTKPPPRPAVTIYNGVQEPGTVPTRRAWTPADPVRIIFGGRFEHQKGTDLLPEILAKVRPPTPGGAKLELFGSGAHAPLLRQLATRPPAGWTIKVCAPVPDFATRIGDYDLLIIPSRYEGLGLVAVEAFLAGVPVVATDAEGLGDALPEGHPWRAMTNNARSFATVLQQALDHPETWAQVAEAGRALARQRFSPAAMAAGYRSLYQLALGG